MKGLFIDHNNRNIFVAQVFIRVGSVFERKGEYGLTHLLEHMMFKTKENCSSKELLMELNKLGCVFNANTSKDYTSFYVRTIESNWKKCVNLLNTIVFKPKFLKSDLSKEKKVVIEEFLQYEDDVYDKAITIAYKNFLPEHNGYRRSIKGSLKDIKNVDIETLKEYYEKHYTKCMIYISCSKKLHKTVEKEVVKVFGNKISSKWDMKCNFMQPRHNSTVVKVINVPKIAQNATVVMFNGLCHNDKRNIVLGFIWDILTGSLNSLLMIEIREKRGLVYGISSFNDAYKDFGVTGIYFGSSNNDTDKVILYIMKILKRLKLNGLSQNILTYSKASYINKLKYRLTDIEFECERSMIRKYYGCDWDERLIISTLQKITNNDIISCCQDIFDFNNMSVVSLGKYDNTKIKEKQIFDAMRQSVL